LSGADSATQGQGRSRAEPLYAGGIAELNINKKGGMGMSNGSSSSSGGIGFLGLLTILFVALKLTGKIAWSWWWVLSPLWISAIIGIVILSIVLAIAIAKS